MQIYNTLRIKNSVLVEAWSCKKIAFNLEF